MTYTPALIRQYAQDPSVLCEAPDHLLSRDGRHEGYEGQREVQHSIMVGLCRMLTCYPCIRTHVEQITQRHHLLRDTKVLLTSGESDSVN